MIFQEKKQAQGFIYTVEDIFGTIDIESDAKLDPETLDGMVVLLLRQNLNAGEIKGEVKHAKGTVKYVFRPRATWEDDDEEAPCNDIPTSTSKPERESSATSPLLARALSWSRRFAGAFREAWKKAKQ